jgi:3-deoxy-D-manno-octulosonic acid (KDO) 8-phosphate synthase
VDVHPNPAEALCDGPQALTTAEFPVYAREVCALANAVEALRRQTEPNPRSLLCQSA